jgi:hypothetical protein
LVRGEVETPAARRGRGGSWSSACDRYVSRNSHHLFLAALQPTALKKVFKSLGGLYQERIHVRLQLTRGRESSR